MRYHALMDQLTTTQVADIAGVTISTVTRWAAAGKLTPIQPSGPRGELRFRRADVEAVVHARNLLRRQARSAILIDRPRP